MEIKHLEVDEEVHSILKSRARKKGRWLKTEVDEILRKELNIEKVVDFE